MKAIRFASALSVVALLFSSCGKDSPVQVEEPKPIEEQAAPQVENPKKPVKPKEDIVQDAYNSLGLVPLDMGQAGLPPMPKPWTAGVYPRDKAFDDFEERRQKMMKDAPPGLSGGTQGYVKAGTVIIPKYGKPVGFTLGKVTTPWEVNRDEDCYAWNHRNEKGLVLTFAFEPSEQYVESNTRSRRKSFLFDSLNRVHQVGPASPRVGLLPYAPMPYDLRRLIVAHQGVDISPLFCIRYEDYREAVRLGDFSKAVYADARVSEMTMKDLDWIYGGLFRLYPLTEDYPSFTLIGIRKDGTIFKRDLRYPLD